MTDDKNASVQYVMLRTVYTQKTDMDYEYPVRFDNQDCMLSKTHDKDCDRVSIRHDKDCEYPYVMTDDKDCECP